MATWSLVLDDRAGAARAFLVDFTFSLKRKLDGGAELQFEGAVDSTGAGFLQVGARRLRAYRDGVLVFHGDVDEPLTSDAQAVRAIARDPWAELTRTPLVPFAGEISFAAEDAGEIAASMIDDWSQAAVRSGTIAPSVVRDRTYEIGKKISEIITQLAEVDDGFHFVIDPIEYDASGPRPVIAELNVRYPLAGTDLPGVRFEYGEGTLANLAGFEEELRLPRNFVLALGAQDSSGGGPSNPPFQETAEDTASQDTYGFRPDVISWSDVTDPDTLAQHAQGALIPKPQALYTVDASPLAPRLFDNFDVGDTCRLRILEGRVDVDVAVRIDEATIKVDESGLEDLEVVLATENAKKAAVKPSQRLFQAFTEADTRLRALERRPSSS